MPSVVPPGWPTALVGPEHAEFPERAVTWLLDQGPADLRSHEVFRRHPAVLAHVVSAHVAAALAGARAAYASARRDLAPVAGPETIEATLVALERHGAGLSALAREVALVEEALNGRRWQARL